MHVCNIFGLIQGSHLLINTRTEQKEIVKQGTGISSETWNERYLGLPVYVGRSRKQVFAYVKDAIWRRMQGWKKRLLDKVGKEVLVKAVAQAIPTYAMSCFYLTKNLCEEISSLIARFWWSQQDNESKIHWIGWPKLTQSKAHGGLGFRDIHSFNIAMLSRQIWRLIQKQESLYAQLLKAKYYPDGNILNAAPKDGISYTWRSLLHGLELVKQGYIWRIGDGQQVNI